MYLTYNIVDVDSRNKSNNKKHDAVEALNCSSERYNPVAQDNFGDVYYDTEAGTTLFLPEDLDIVHIFGYDDRIVSASSRGASAAISCRKLKLEECVEVEVTE